MHSPPISSSSSNTPQHSTLRFLHTESLRLDCICSGISLISNTLELTFWDKCTCMFLSFRFRPSPYHRDSTTGMFRQGSLYGSYLAHDEQIYSSCTSVFDRMVHASLTQKSIPQQISFPIFGFGIILGTLQCHRQLFYFSYVVVIVN